MKDSLTRCQSVLFRRVVLLGVFVIAPGCTNLATPNEGIPASGVDPGYSKIVATYMKYPFPSLSPSDAVEISQPRWVQSEKGWNWLACVRFQDHGRRRTFSVFFNGSAVVDARFSVLTDACATQSYLPLDLSGAQRPGAIGDNGPLY